MAYFQHHKTCITITKFHREEILNQSKKPLDKLLPVYLHVWYTTPFIFIDWNTIFPLCGFHSLLATFLGSYPIPLASLIFWVLQGNFKFMAFCSNNWDPQMILWALHMGLSPFWSSGLYSTLRSGADVLGGHFTVLEFPVHWALHCN